MNETFFLQDINQFGLAVLLPDFFKSNYLDINNNWKESYDFFDKYKQQLYRFNLTIKNK